MSVVPSASTTAEIVDEGDDFFDRTEELESGISLSESHGTVLDRCKEVDREEVSLGGSVEERMVEPTSEIESDTERSTEFVVTSITFTD